MQKMISYLAHALVFTLGSLAALLTFGKALKCPSRSWV